MRITLAAIGSRGDLQPYVALGLGLKAHGHDVLVASHAPYEGLVRSYGLNFHVVTGDPNEVLRGASGQGLQGSGNAARYIQRVREIAETLIVQLTRDCLVACQDADLVLTTSLGIYPIYSVLEKLGIAGGLGGMQPATATRSFPHYQFPPFPQRIRGRRRYNRLTYLGVQQLYWRALRAPINLARREVLNLPPFSMRDAVARVSAMLRLYGYSPWIVPQPSDWLASHHVTGYWFLDPPATWEPPEVIVRFLASGPPPVYVGFGSMRSAEPQKELDLIISALAQAGQRGVILNCSAISMNRCVPEDVLLIDEIPHAWLFPQMAAVVHHGGAGTTAAGLRAGLPTVTVPFFTDQPFWGRRIYDLGLGPEPLPHKELTAGKLAAAIRQAVSDPQLKRRATAFKAQLQKEDGIATAVCYLEKHFYGTAF